MLPSVVPAVLCLELFRGTLDGLVLLLASTPGSEHQSRRRDPEEEDEDFSDDAKDGDGGGAAREGVGAMVGESEGTDKSVT